MPVNKTLALCAILALGLGFLFFVKPALTQAQDAGPQPLVFLKLHNLEYPQAAARLRLTEDFVVQVSIGPDGKLVPSTIEFLSGKHPELLAAVKQNLSLMQLDPSSLSSSGKVALRYTFQVADSQTGASRNSFRFEAPNHFIVTTPRLTETAYSSSRR